MDMSRRVFQVEGRANAKPECGTSQWSSRVRRDQKQNEPVGRQQKIGQRDHGRPAPGGLGALTRFWPHFEFDKKQLGGFVQMTGVIWLPFNRTCLVWRPLK